MNPKKTRSTLLASLIFSAAACVTVNVNFPESAVQKATDDYVRELYRAKEKGKPAQPSGTSTRLNRFEIFASAYAGSEVYAADAPTDMRLKLDTAKALEVRDRLRGNLDKVLKYKRMGLLGEGSNGLLEVRKAPKIQEMSEDLNKVVGTENKARKELYSEVSEANKVPLDRVEKSFSRSFQAESPSGTWVNSDGSWEQKQ